VTRSAVSRRSAADFPAARPPAGIPTSCRSLDWSLVKSTTADEPHQGSCTTRGNTVRTYRHSSAPARADRESPGPCWAGWGRSPKPSRRPLLALKGFPWWAPLSCPFRAPAWPPSALCLALSPPSVRPGVRPLVGRRPAPWPARPWPPGRLAFPSPVFGLPSRACPSLPTTRLLCNRPERATCRALPAPSANHP
jgi:hypothetical protein